MQSRPARKSRSSIAVELLEDRRMLTMFAPTPSWDGLDRPMDAQAEAAPLAGGPVVDPSRGDGLETVQPDRNSVDWQGSPGFDRQDSSDGPDAWPGQWMMTEPTPSAGSDTSAPQNWTDSSVQGQPDPSNLPTGPAGLWSTPTASENDPAPPTGSSDRNTGQVSIESVPSTPTASSTATTQTVAPSPVVVPLILASRSAPEFSIARSAPELVQPTARVEASSSVPAPGRASSDETLLAIASAGAPSAEVSTSPEQAKALASVNLPIGPGLSGSPAPTGLTLRPSKDPASLPTPGESPIGTGKGGADLVEAGGGIGSVGGGEVVEAIKLPEPDLAGMIQSFLPFDRSTVEGAIDQMFEPFGELASSMPELRGPLGLITASLTAAATVVAVEVAIRVRRSREGDLGGDDVEGLTTFPGI